MISNALTIDIEDYFQVLAFSGTIPYKDWDKWELRIQANTEKLLAILESVQVRGTFFILGWVADRLPQLIQLIAKNGHAIASHGYAHQLIYTQTPEMFREDVRKTRKMLQDMTGQPILSYRAPCFSITSKTPWAHQILVEEGYLYDSSVFPIHHDLHGNPNAPREIHRIETESGFLIEFPPTIYRFAGQNIPVGGGGYFRFFPYRLTERMLHSVNKSGKPFMFYLHPWELDPEQPRVRGIPFKSRFRHYLNLGRTESRLQRLLQSFSFTNMEAILENWQSEQT
ncbi:MAG: XrtA system polysaccharide deacetylase [Thermoguttaceae bacterium]